MPSNQELYDVTTKTTPITSFEANLQQDVSVQKVNFQRRITLFLGNMSRMLRFSVKKPAVNAVSASLCRANSRSSILLSALQVDTKAGGRNQGEPEDPPKNGFQAFKQMFRRNPKTIKVAALGTGKPVVSFCRSRIYYTDGRGYWMT